MPFLFVRNNEESVLFASDFIESFEDVFFCISLIDERREDLFDLVVLSVLLEYEVTFLRDGDYESSFSQKLESTGHRVGIYVLADGDFPYRR